MDTRILCVGSRFVARDLAGPLVHDWLAEQELPEAVELVDGGLGGLALLPAFEGVDAVVLVDAAQGLGTGEGVHVLPGTRAADLAVGPYGHDGGIAYLLRLLPEVLDGPLPALQLVVVEGEATPARVAEAGEAALAAAGGRQG